MADKVTSLYNALKADGLFKQARSLNDFKAKMAYQGYRSQIYKLARDKGANVGTFSQFTNALGYSSGRPKPKQSYGGYKPQQQNPEENTAMTTAQRAMQVPHRLKTQLGKAQKSAPRMLLLSCSLCMRLMKRRREQNIQLTILHLMLPSKCIREISG